MNVKLSKEALSRLVVPVLLVVSGALNTLAFAPYDIWVVPFLTILTLIFFLNKTQSAKQSAVYGFAYGLGWFGLGISWVHVAIADFGGLPIIGSILLMTILVAYLSLFPAFTLWAWFKLKQKTGLWSLPFLWLISESLRGWMLTGFPWLSLGYSQIEGPFRHLTPIIGEFGLQALIVLVAVLAAVLITALTSALTAKATPLPPQGNKGFLAGCFGFIKKSNISATSRRLDSILALVLIVMLTVFTISTASITWHGQIKRSVKLALVQGNIEQSIKWQPENEVPTMDKYLSMSSSFFDTHDLIIWPEAAVPRLEILANGYLREVDKLAAETNTSLITGIVDYQPETDLAYNNLIVLGKKQADDTFGHYRYLHNNRFNKHHLLPIGEFVPFESLLRKLGPIFDLPMSSFSRGYYQQDNLIAQGLSISPAICFEIAFSEQVRDNLYKDTDIILTVSNDAWFGNSHGPWQHLQIAQMRALEFAKPVVRVTNNGVTAVINSKGEIEQMLPQFKAAVLSQTLNIHEGQTFYQVFGNFFVWCFVIGLTLLAAVLQLLRSKRPENTLD